MTHIVQKQGARPETPSAGALGRPAGHCDWSAAITNFNGEEWVCETIASIKQLKPPPSEILMVDDGSTDAGIERVRTEHPDVRIICLGRNTGVLNIVRNRALHEARHRYVLISDNDIAFARDAVRQLMRALQKHKDAAACTPLVLAADDRRTVLSQGHAMHFLGWATVARATTVEGARELGEYKATGGGIQLIDKVRAAPVGFFDEDLVLGWADDGEFHFRLQLAGLGCYTVPSASVFHRRVRVQSRFYGQLHNRWLLLLKHYQWRTLVLIAPALLVYEFLLAGALLAMGVHRDYGRAIRDVVRDLPRVVRNRRHLRTLRQLADRNVLSAEALTGPRALLERKIIRVGLNVLSSGFRLYWVLVYPLLGWPSASTPGQPGSCEIPATDQASTGSSSPSAAAIDPNKTTPHA